MWENVENTSTHAFPPSTASSIFYCWKPSKVERESFRKWSLKFSVAAAITRGTCQREMITCRGVTCIMLTGELIGPISSCLGPAATCRELECDISATYYWDVLHFISHSSVGIIIRIYLRDLHKISTFRKLAIWGEVDGSLKTYSLSYRIVSVLILTNNKMKCV